MKYLATLIVLATVLAMTSQSNAAPCNGQCPAYEQAQLAPSTPVLAAVANVVTAPARIAKAIRQRERKPVLRVAKAVGKFVFRKHRG